MEKEAILAVNNVQQAREQVPEVIFATRSIRGQDCHEREGE